MSKMFSVMVFDCDGTLVDCSKMIELLYRGYRKYYPNRTYKNYEYFIPCYFMTEMQMIEYLEISLYDKKRFFDICFGVNGEFMNEIQLFPNIRETLRLLHEKGVRLGINTSRNYASFSSLQLLLQDEYSLFEPCLIVTSDQLSFPKPHPQALQMICEQSGCSKKEILMIGDSENDALCAKNADCPFAYARWGSVCDQKIPFQYELTNPKQLLFLND